MSGEIFATTSFEKIAVRLRAVRRFIKSILGSCIVILRHNRFLT